MVVSISAKHANCSRLRRLLRSEQAVLEVGGCVVRLAGLYHAQVRPTPAQLVYSTFEP